jgi:serine protease AprX
MNKTQRLFARFVWLSLTGSSLLGCSQPDSVDQDATTSAPLSALPAVASTVKVPSQPIDVVHHAVLRNGAPIEVGTTALASDAYHVDSVVAAPKPQALAAKPARIIDAALDKRVATAEAAGATQGLIDVVITFREEIQLPRFPEPNENEPRSSRTNLTAAAQAQQQVKDIKAARGAGHARRAQELAANHSAKVVDQFWLINGMQARLPIGQIRALAARSDVQYVEENEKHEPPPGNNSSDARADMVSDPYFNLNLTGGWIGLLDTGIRTSHTLLTHWAFLRDCVNGGSDCNTGVGLNTDDDFWNHGTSSASELTANGNLGDANRGVTGIFIDSWKVYTSAGLDTAASVRGFQAAIPALDRVIVAEIQAASDENSSISAAADAAYNAGAVVVAANGNFGSGASTVRSPGNARKALGVGAADVSTLALQGYSGRGPTNDGRTKPDILGPTNVVAASNAGTTALQTFGGTSSATPNAAGATALFRNFIRGSNFEVDPGQINALMIMSGTNFSFPATDNNNGSGFINLPVNGHIWWAGVTAPVSPDFSQPRPVVDIPLSIGPAPGQAITVAIWWPESIGSTHNDVDLHLINPSGVVVASSTSVSSVFEKVRATGALPTGTWKVRVTSWNVHNPQTVYYALKLQ